jgi:hypothetical protein
MRRPEREWLGIYDSQNKVEYGLELVHHFSILISLPFYYQAIFTILVLLFVKVYISLLQKMH